MTSPVLSEEDIDDFVELIEGKEVKDYSDSDAYHKGDIVVSEGITNVIYKKVVFICPMCGEAKDSKRELGIHLKDTIDADHSWTPKMITDFLDEYEGEEREEKISKANIYYEVVEPREIIPLPQSVEVDISKVLKKGSRPPTAREREIHDYEIVLWREQMKDLSKRSEVIPSKNYKHGFEEKGPSGNWWYWRPEIWKQDQWLHISELDLKNWRTSKHRTLQLLTILPIE